MNEFENTLAEIDRLLDDGEIDSAVRVSADLLAAVDDEWTRLRNDGRPTGQSLLKGSVAGSRHVEALLIAGQTRDAYATSLMLLLKETIDGSVAAGLDSARMVILYFAVRSLTTLADSIDSDDSESAGHASEILSMLGGMLYEVYATLSSSGCDNPYLNPVYSTLKEMRDIGAIRYPAVTIRDREVPVSDHRTLLGDIIGRSRAMGWFVCD